MPKTIETTAALNNQVQIPYLGLGTWQSKKGECAHAVEFALTHGYSHIDTAQIYGNEAQVGQGWQASGRSREDIFITTKIWNFNQGGKRTRRSLEKSLKRLKTDYVDLCLIHWPNIKNFSRTQKTWETLVERQQEGQCRAIGVSNFTIPLIEKLIEDTKITPAVNQVEFHPFLFQKDLLEFCQAKGIQLEAYSPLARAQFFENQTLQDIAQKYDKTPAQVMLSWGLQHNLVVIPKSTHEKRIQENSQIFFDLSEEDMAKLDALTPQKRLIKPMWAPETW